MPGARRPLERGQSGREAHGRVVCVDDVRLEPPQRTIDCAHGGEHLARAPLDQREVEPLRARRQLGRQLAVLGGNRDGVTAFGGGVGKGHDHPLGAAHA